MRRLNESEIDVKVKQVNANGCLLLLYKTARVDMQILDETYGVDNWTCDYKTINGVLYCGIGVWSDKANNFVYKWDCGIESRADEDGNEKKGEASDAFKRAGFKWGIGRELYSAPFIWVKLPTKKNEKGKYDLVDKFQKFFVKTITYNDLGEIVALSIVDNNNKLIFKYKAGGDVKQESEPEMAIEDIVEEVLSKITDKEKLLDACKDLKTRFPKHYSYILKAYNNRLAEIAKKGAK